MRDHLTSRRRYSRGGYPADGVDCPKDLEAELRASLDCFCGRWRKLRIFVTACSRARFADSGCRFTAMLGDTELLAVFFWQLYGTHVAVQKHVAGESGDEFASTIGMRHFIFEADHA